MTLLLTGPSVDDYVIAFCVVWSVNWCVAGGGSALELYLVLRHIFCIIRIIRSYQWYLWCRASVWRADAGSPLYVGSPPHRDPASTLPHMGALCSDGTCRKEREDISESVVGESWLANSVVFWDRIWIKKSHKTLYPVFNQWMTMALLFVLFEVLTDVWQEAGLLERGGVLELARGRRLTEQEALLVHDQDHW